MARKRRRGRRFNATPLLIAAALLAIVIWAIYPRSRPHRTTAPAPRHVAIELTATPAASLHPTTSPTSTTTPIPSPALVPKTLTPATHPRGVRVAIIIDDCGQWIKTEEAFVALPIPLTLAVLPYVTYTTKIAADASAAGQGVMLHLPMEPISHINPGPGEIKTDMTDAEIAKQTQDDLAQVPLASGVNNHEGSEATANARVVNDVLGVLKARGLFFIDSRTSAQSIAATQARREGVPSASRDVFLDDTADVAYVESMLERAAAIARRNGSAIAIGHPRPTTLTALREMYPKMQAQGVQFVFVRTLVQ